MLQNVCNVKPQRKYFVNIVNMSVTLNSYEQITYWITKSDAKMSLGNGQLINYAILFLVTMSGFYKV